MQKKLVAFSLSLFTLIPKPSSTTYASGSLTTPLILPESCSNSSHSPGNDTDFDLALSALRLLFNEEETEKSISKAGQKKPSQWLKDRPKLLEKWKKIYERKRNEKKNEPKNQQISQMPPMSDDEKEKVEQTSQDDSDKEI